MPASGFSWDDARAYTQWLDRSGRVPGARPCQLREWERAARGADDRLYPHGDRITGDDANIDATYGRKPASFGPDEVGSHGASDSPFGIADLTGNIWELVATGDQADGVVIRGGGWYNNAFSARSNNSEPGESSMRSPDVGFRVCASISARR
jgi:eukaryotic-like serine/threonine-protein kinase